MVKHLKWVAVGVLLVSGIGATTGPSTGPSGGDYSEPKKAVESFLTSLQKGDEAGARGALVTTPEAKGTVDLFLKVIFATGRLQKAALEHFGAGAEKYFGSSTENVLATRMKTVEDATVKVTGDSAVITIPADEAQHQTGGTVVLVKSETGWKIDGASLFGVTTMSKAEVDRQAALAAKLIPITDQATKDIADGKYPGAADAYQDFWNKSLGAMKAVDAANSTQPATQK